MLYTATRRNLRLPAFVRSGLLFLIERFRIRPQTNRLLQRISKIQSNEFLQKREMYETAYNQILHRAWSTWGGLLGFDYDTVDF